MWSPNGKVWSPEMKSVESKILTHLTVSHAEIAEWIELSQHVKRCYVF